MLKRTLISTTLILVLLGTAVVLAQENGDATRGAALYAENCLSCHGPRGEARATHEAFAGVVQYDINFVEVVNEGIADSFMGPWGESHGGLLDEREVNDLRAFAQSWFTGDAPPLPEPVIPASVQEQDAAAGAALYAINCASCHGVEGQGRGSERFPAIPFGADMLVVTRRGNESAGMPPFAEALGGPLSEAEIDRIAEYTRTWDRPSDLQALAADSPQGAGLLVLLMGIGALAAIGGIAFLGRGEL